MAVTDLNEEWLGHVQPVGLVVAPVVLARLDLVPSQQTRADSEALVDPTRGDRANPATSGGR
jgi:hypothetical protein